MLQVWSQAQTHTSRYIVRYLNYFATMLVINCSLSYQQSGLVFDNITSQRNVEPCWIQQPSRSYQTNFIMPSRPEVGPDIHLEEIMI